MDSFEAIFQHLFVNWDLDIRQQTSKKDDKDDIVEDVSDSIKLTVETLCSKMAHVMTLLVPSASSLTSNNSI